MFLLLPLPVTKTKHQKPSTKFRYFDFHCHDLKKEESGGALPFSNCNNNKNQNKEI